MDGSYTFDIDAKRSLVRMALQGFFTPEQSAEFNEARRVAYRRLRCAPNQHITIIDMRGTTIQSQEAVTLFSQAINDPITKSRRVAFVVSRSLARLQVKRAAERENVGFFERINDAEVWLLDEVRLAS